MIRLDQFTPLEPVPDGEKGTYRARSQSTAVEIFVHFYRNSAAAEGEVVAEQLGRFPKEDRQRILDFGRDRRLIFFITQELPGNQNFVQWTRAILAEPVPGFAVPAAPSSLRVTRQAPAVPAADDAVRVQPALPDDAINKHPNPAPQGEYTRYYAGRLGERAPQPIDAPPVEYPPSPRHETLLRRTGTGRRPEPESAGRQDAMEFYVPPAGGREISYTRRASSQASNHPRVRAAASRQSTPPARDLFEHRKPLLITAGIVIGAGVIIIVLAKLFGWT